MDKRVNLFWLLADQVQLRTNKQGWVFVQDAIVEIKLVGGWTVSDRGPRVSQELCTSADLLDTQTPKKELLVQGQVGCLMLYRQSVDPAPSINILDRFIAYCRMPSEHADGRPDLRIRRG